MAAAAFGREGKQVCAHSAVVYGIIIGNWASSWATHGTTFCLRRYERAAYLHAQSLATPAPRL